MIHSIGNPPAPPNPTTFGGSYEADKRSVSFDLCDNDDLEKKGNFVVSSGKENIFHLSSEIISHHHIGNTSWNMKMFLKCFNNPVCRSRNIKEKPEFFNYVKTNIFSRKHYFPPFFCAPQETSKNISGFLDHFSVA